MNLGYATRTLLLVIAMLLCASCCSAPSVPDKTRYIVTLSIGPEGSCTFVSAAELPGMHVREDKKPSDGFLKAACRYFLAVYSQQRGPTVPSREETVGWYSDNPDVPLYIPHVDM